MSVKHLSRVLLTAAVFAATGLLVPGSLSGQSGEPSSLSFKEDLWDFGNIKETDGPVSHTFEFTNTGQNAIVIERVSVSCGCTTPEYSKEPVLPGKKGKIKVTYDPEMRPGYFSKDIYVVSNNGKNNDRLIVKGEVEGKPRTVEQDYPYLYSDKLRINTVSANFRYVPHGATSVQAVKYANVSTKPVKLTFEVSPSDGVVTVEDVNSICAGCKGEVKLRLRVPVEQYGKLNYKVYPVVDGVRQKLGITVTAIATEDFSNSRPNEQPSAKVTPSYQHMGKIKKGQSASHTFLLENTGNSPLIVRRVIEQDGIWADLKEGTTVAPGKSVKIKCTLDTKTAAAGNYTKLVTVIFNDPVRPMRELRLAATVE